jgi:hypothetical protein
VPKPEIHVRACVFAGLPVELDVGVWLTVGSTPRRWPSRWSYPRVVRAKKDVVLKATGRLACEACDLDFAERYGELGEGFIECHHTVPLGRGSERVTSLSDLALLCPNCHRMIHRPARVLTVAELRERLAKSVSRAPLGHDQAMESESGA